MPRQIPDYVILSHLWGNEEITFENFTKQGTIDPEIRETETEKQSLSKVKGACALAARDGYEWIWIDTCCIDKSSSAELQETINTMWRYYAQSNICYVYMNDIPNAQAGWSEAFRTSRWFTRGWTLQELIAPTSVEFYAQDWAAIGTKSERYEEISEATKINAEVLTHKEPIDAFSAAEKLSWAAHRQVTREEDETYCLLGIFEVNMPMLYGEGRRKAFVRLQEAIYSSTLDHSLFLFSQSAYSGRQPLLADCPVRFCPEQNSCSHCPAAVRMLPPTISYAKLITASNWNVQAHDQIWATMTSSRHEASTTLQLLDYDIVADKLIFLEKNSRPIPPTHIAVLNHTLEDYQSGALCLLLYQQRKSDENDVAFVRLQSYPVILPRIKEFATKMRSKRILVVPAHKDLISRVLRSVAASFKFTSESFVVQNWRSKYVLHQREVRIEGCANADLIVQTEGSRLRKQPSEVSCRIIDAVEQATQINIQLVLIGKDWSIKEVYELKSRRRDRIQHRPFYSQVLCDRCSIATSDGLRWSIALRRLPSSRLEPNDEKLIRYQIVISRLEMEAPNPTQITRRT
ncbi:hypothetical protein NUW58_g1544 [Xylaria curta]|uniref:Uncharacterized protein n=1 Tax=Xylaria curta TaxID=42375 RepID=A0ACC1PJQ5_9PEZI|nr:hypothetical protein NUW58_g1544 [Xylaria curta]